MSAKTWRKEVIMEPEELNDAIRETQAIIAENKLLLDEFRDEPICTPPEEL